MSDFSTCHNLQSEITLTTDLVIIPVNHSKLQYTLDRFRHIDYRFNIVVTAYHETQIKEVLTASNYTIINSREGCYGLILHKSLQNSFISKKIQQGAEIEIDKEQFFLPSFDKTMWSQSRNKVIFNSPEGEIEFEVPTDFSLTRTSHCLLWIIEYVLLSPWNEKYNEDWVPIRRPGKKPGLSFSGGIDSTAAFCLMPEDTILFYLERNFPSLIKHQNAHFFNSELRKRGKTVINVPSNHEKIRANHGKNPGFSTDYACMAHLILLADHYDLDAAATGMPLENAYFYHGSSVRDFAESRFWRHYSSIFAFAGLPLYQPVAGCSEILTSKIVDASDYTHLSSSCLRSPVVGEKCEVCWKCFRKNIFNKQPWKMSNEISTFLRKRPLKQGLATLYALQLMEKSGDAIPEEASDLIPILNEDLDFLNQYWPPYLDLLPEKYRQFTKEKLENFSSPMTKNLLAVDQKILATLRGDES